MKNFLFILYDYYPNPNVNTICMQKYIDEIIKRGHNVDVITAKHSLEMNSFEIVNKVNVYRFDNWYINLIKALNIIKLQRLPLTIRVFFTPFFYLLKLISRLYDGKNIGKVHWEFDIIGAVEKAVALNKTKQYDAMIAVSFPFITQIIGSEIKLKAGGSKIKFIAYDLDPFTDNYSLPKRQKSKRMELEKKVFNNADMIVITPEMAETATAKYFQDFSKKIVIQPLPNLVERTFNTSIKTPFQKQESKIECVYTGTFYKIIRNPEFMLKFFSCDQFKNFRIHIFGLGCEEILYKYKGIIGDRLILYGGVPSEHAVAALEHSDIMLNIGNRISNQTPSKIFDMISIGKPIVNFYSITNDSSLKYFENYPLVLNINTSDKIEKSINPCVEFCTINKGRKIDFCEATKHVSHYRANYVINDFLKYLDI